MDYKYPEYYEIICCANVYIYKNGINGPYMSYENTPWMFSQLGNDA